MSKLNESDFQILNQIESMLLSKFECTSSFKKEKAKELRMIIRKIKRVD